MEKETFLQLSKRFWKKGVGLALSSRGASRGIGTLWDEQKFELIESKQYTHWIYTKLLHKETNIQVILFNIYVPNIFAEKKRLLELFEGSQERHIAGKHHSSW